MNKAKETEKKKNLAIPTNGKQTGLDSNIHESFNYGIPGRIMFAKDISPHAKLYYAFLRNLSNKYGYSWGTNEYFAERFGCHPNSVSNWTNELAAHPHFKEVPILQKEGKDKGKPSKGKNGKVKMRKVPVSESCGNYIHVEMHRERYASGEIRTKRRIRLGDERVNPPNEKPDKGTGSDNQEKPVVAQLAEALEEIERLRAQLIQHKPITNPCDMETPVHNGLLDGYAQEPVSREATRICEQNKEPIKEKETKEETLSKEEREGFFLKVIELYGKGDHGTPYDAEEFTDAFIDFAGKLTQKEANQVVYYIEDSITNARTKGDWQWLVRPHTLIKNLPGAAWRGYRRKSTDKFMPTQRKKTRQERLAEQLSGPIWDENLKSYTPEEMERLSKVVPRSKYKSLS